MVFNKPRLLGVHGTTGGFHTVIYRNRKEASGRCASSGPEPKHIPSAPSREDFAMRDTWRHFSVSTRAMTAPIPPPTAMTAAGLNSCAAAPAATKAAPWPTITPMLARQIGRAHVL